MNNLTKETEFTKAFNRIDEGYGRHGVDLRFILKGPEGAITLTIFTGWFTKADRANTNLNPLASQVVAADISYHSITQKLDFIGGEEDCPYVPEGELCYCDGSSLNAVRYLDILTDEGEDALWGALEEYYNSALK
jgi:hypothetical protein